VEPDYLPDSEVCFSHVWIPFPDEGVCGGFPPTIVTMGGTTKINGPPLVGDSGD
jgi:hypothetical protein